MFTRLGPTASLTEGDILEPAIAAEEAFRSTALTPLTAPTPRRLAQLKPRTLALMHGASFRGDGAAALWQLADYYEGQLLGSCPLPGA